MSVFNPFNHFGFLTNRVGRLIGLKMDGLMKENDYNLPHSCIGILADLWLQDGQIQKDLSISMIKNKSTISTMLDGLLEYGMIYKEVNHEDKRNKRIFLTEKGKQMQHIVVSKSKEAEIELLEGCTKEEIETAKKVLTTLYKNLSENIYNTKK